MTSQTYLAVLALRRSDTPPYFVFSPQPPRGSEPSISHRRLLPTVLAPSAYSRATRLFTCHISEHPNSSLSILTTQLVFWICGLRCSQLLCPLVTSVPFSLSSHFETLTGHILDIFALSSMASNLFYIFHFFISLGCALDNFSSSVLQISKSLVHGMLKISTKF